MDLTQITKKILNKENINYINITKINSGFTNICFSIDEKFIVKINFNNNEKLEKEIEFYKNISFPFMPKLISSGKIDDYTYLIIEKIKGQSLYYLWHTFDNSKRKNIIAQMCYILKTIHSIKNINFLKNNFIYKNWFDFFKNSFDSIIKKLIEFGCETTFLEMFINKKLKEIMSEQKNAIIYNDAHFDNFIYDGEKLFLIDFDRIIFSPIDYELLIISSMAEKPEKFANEECEKFCNKNDYEPIFKWINEFYPELFDFNFLNERLFVYKFVYNINNAFKFNHKNTIENEIKKFKNFFNL